MSRTKLLLIFSFILAFFCLANHASAATRTWDGGGGDNNWSTAANWSSDTIPTSSDDVVFDGGTSTKDATWDSSGPATIQSLTVNANYSGMLTMGRDVTVSANWTFSGSNFNAGSYKISLSGAGGTFTLGSVNYYDLLFSRSQYSLVSGTANVTHNLTIAGGYGPAGGPVNVGGNVTVSAPGDWSNGFLTINLNGTGDQTLTDTSGTFPAVVVNKNSGAVIFGGDITANKWTWTSGSSLSPANHKLTITYNTFVPGSVNYYDVAMGNSNVFTGITGTANVLHNLTFSGAYGSGGGAINVGGDVAVAISGSWNGDTVINLNGTGNQTVTNSVGYLQSFSVNKPSGTVIFNGTISINGNYTWTKGNLSAGTSTLKLVNDLISRNFLPGNVSYYNVESNQAAGYTTNLTGNLVATNNFTMTQGIIDTGGYTIRTKNYVQSGVNSTLTANASPIIITGNFTKSGGNFTYGTSTVSFQGTNQSINVGGTAVTFYNLYKLTNDADTFTINNGANITIASGGTMRLWGKPEGKTLSVVSSTPGSGYNITKTGSWEAEYANITDMRLNTAVTAAASSLGTGTSNVQVTKEFISTIRSAGGDYTTLSAWNTAIGVNLTAADTKVFSISSGAGTIPDNSGVTGATSNATATAVHVSVGNQVLLKTISGTFQNGETVWLTSDHNQYVVLSDAGYGAIARVDCYPLTDSTGVLMNNWTADSTHFVLVRTPIGYRPNGKWDANKYILEGSVASTGMLRINSPFVWIDGLQIKNDYSSSGSNGIYLAINNASSETVISNCIFQGIGSRGKWAISNDGNANPLGKLRIWNNVMYNFKSGGLGNALYLINASGTAYVYNNTFYNNYSGITQASVTIVAKNNISSAVTSDNYSGSFDAASDYNTSSDTTAPGTHSQKSVALASMKFSSTASGSENLHIVKTSIAVNKATDLSVDPNLPITDDADGESRLALDPSAWSIGADQYYPTYEATLGVGGTSVTPIAWYKFDEGVGSTAYNSGSSAPQLNGALGAGTSAPTWTNDGKFGKALSFDGANDYVDIATLPTITGNVVSESVWFYRKSNSTNYECIVTIGNDSGQDYGAYSICSMADGKIRANAENHYSNYIVSDNVISNNAWHHAAMVSDGANYYLYIDGVRQSTSRPCSDPVVQFFRIGKSRTSSQYFDGLIDEPKIFNYALTADQVKREYNGGNVLQLGSSGSISGTGLPTNAASGDYCVPGDTTACASPVGEWKMEEKTGTTVNDTSGNGNNGNINGATWTQGKFGSGLVFDGNGYFGLSSSPVTTWQTDPGISIGMWVKNWPNQQRKCAIELYDSANPERRITICSSAYSPYNRIQATAGRIYSEIEVRVYSASAIDSNWHYIVFEASNTVGNLYIDGQLSGTDTSVAPSGTMNLNVGVIGSGNTANSDIDSSIYSFSGSIDQVRIYNYARTPAQIAWEYNQGAPVARYKFNEGIGSTANNDGSGGSSLNGALGTGTSAPTWTTAGKYGNALSFDGSDDYISIGSTVPIVNSISLWIKPTSTTQSVADLDGGSHKISISSGVVTATGFTSYYVDGKLNGTVSDTNWHHITAISSSSFTTTSSLKIGAISSTYFSGLIDDVKIYNYGLTAEQVRQDYNNSSVMFFKDTSTSQ